MFFQTTRATHKRWLGVSAVLIAMFGPVALLATTKEGTESARFAVTLISQKPHEFSDTTRFLCALLGGFLFGWGVLIWCLRAWVYDIAPEQVRRCVLASVMTWIVIHSIGSALSENYFNVVMNVDVLLLIVGPMWLPAVEDAIGKKGKEVEDKTKKQ